MILTRCLLTLLGIIVLQSEGAECIIRMKRQVQKLGSDIVSSNVADADTDRPARCVPSPFRRFRDRVDGDLIAKYFSGNGLSLGCGSLLGSPKQQTEEMKTGTGDADLSSTAKNVDLSATPGSNGDASTTDSVLGASNPFGSETSAINPLLRVATAWLQPQTLLAMRNGMQASGTQGIVGQHNPNSISSSGSENDNNKMDSMQVNMVGSPHQNTAGDYRSMQAFDLNAYPAATIAGMTPYSYVVGAPNPIYIQGGADVPPMQPYLYNYDSVVGAQNPSFMGGNQVGSSPYWNCPLSVRGSNNLESTRSSISEDKGLDETAQAAEDLIGQPNPDPSPELENTDFNSNGDSKTTQSVDDGGIVGSKQTINPEEVKDRSLGPSSDNIKQKQNKLKFKKNLHQAKNGAD